jgi:hypothetical protein
LISESPCYREVCEGGRERGERQITVPKIKVSERTWERVKWMLELISKICEVSERGWEGVYRLFELDTNSKVSERG